MLQKLAFTVLAVALLSGPVKPCAGLELRQELQEKVTQAHLLEKKRKKYTKNKKRDAAFLKATQEGPQVALGIEVGTGDLAIRVVTNVKLDGASDPLPIFIDTGSSTLALCLEDGNVGDSTPNPGMYACNAYGDGTYGWNGTFRTGNMAFGTENEYEEAGSPVMFADIDWNGVNCPVPGHGIAGVNFYSNEYFQQPIPRPSIETPDCLNAPRTKLDGPAPLSKAAFLQGNDYTLAFIGLNLENEGNSVLAFGQTAQNLLAEYGDKVAEAPLQSNFNLWMALDASFTYEFFGFPACLKNPCKSTYTPTGGEKVIIDSGTPPVEIPPSVVEDLFGEEVVKEIQLQGNFELAPDQRFNVTFGGQGAGQLSFGAEDFVQGTGGLQLGTPSEDAGCFGFASMLKYDMQITGNPETGQGKVGFYSKKAPV